MNTSVAINLFAKAVLRERRIPFEIALNHDPFYNEVNQARLSKAIERMEAGNGTVHDLIEEDNDYIFLKMGIVTPFPNISSFIQLCFDTTPY